MNQLRKKRTGYIFTLFPLRPDYVRHGKRVHYLGIMPCHRDEYNLVEHFFCSFFPFASLTGKTCNPYQYRHVCCTKVEHTTEQCQIFGKVKPDKIVMVFFYHRIDNLR